MVRAIFSFVLALALTSPVFACRTSGHYYFFEKLQDRLLENDFVAHVEILEFKLRRGEFAGKITVEDGEILVDGKSGPIEELLPDATVKYRILNVLKGQTEANLVTQNLFGDSCTFYFLKGEYPSSNGYWVPDSPQGKRYFVSGDLVDGQPVIRQY